MNAHIRKEEEEIDGFSSSLSSAEEGFDHIPQRLETAPGIPITSSASTSSLGEMEEEQQDPLDDAVISDIQVQRESLQILQEHITNLESTVVKMQAQTSGLLSGSTLNNEPQLSVQDERLLNRHLSSVRQQQLSSMTQRAAKEEAWQRRIEHLSTQLTRHAEAASPHRGLFADFFVKLLLLIGVSKNSLQQDGDTNTNSKSTLRMVLLFLWSLVSFQLWNSLKVWFQSPAYSSSSTQISTTVFSTTELKNFLANFFNKFPANLFFPSSSTKSPSSLPHWWGINSAFVFLLLVPLWRWLFQIFQKGRHPSDNAFSSHKTLKNIVSTSARTLLCHFSSVECSVDRGH